MSSVSEVLKEAWAAVGESGLVDSAVPAEVQAAGLSAAVRLIAGGSGGSGQSAGSIKTDPKPAAGVPAEGGLGEAEFLDRIAKNAGVPVADLDKCFFLEEGEPRIAIPGVKLGKNNADRARAIAQLLIVGRGYGIPENDTLLEVIRSEVIRQKVYDSANFSSQLNGLAQAGYVGTGSGKNKKWRAKSPAIEAFPKFVTDLLTRAAP